MYEWKCVFECECVVCASIEAGLGKVGLVGYLGSEPREMETGQKIGELWSVECVMLCVR